MDHREKLVDSLRSITAAALTVLTALAVVCAYLLQRALLVLADGDIASSHGYQARQAGLEFSYRTLSLLWPAVVAALCLAFRFLAAKEIMVARRLMSDSVNLSSEVLTSIVPYLITPRMLGMEGAARVFRWLSVVPFIAASFHLASLLAAATMFLASPYRLNRLQLLPKAELLGSGVLITAIALFAFWATWEFSAAVRSLEELDSRPRPRIRRSRR